MRIKICLIIIITCLLLTGCSEKEVDAIENETINYNLDIGKTFNEKIIFSFDNNKIYAVDDEFDGEYEDYFSRIANHDIRSLYYDTDKFYKKVVNKDKNINSIMLNYEYIEDEFVYSNIIMSCFEHFEINSKDEYFEIKLNGEFTCLDDMNKVDINIMTNYNVIDTNGNKIGNTYNWIIDKNNYSNVDIRFRINRDYNDMSKKSVNNRDVTKGIGKIIVLLGLLALIYKLFVKIKIRFGL